MNLVTLQRFDSTDQGTFGEMAGPFGRLDTLELPWRDNAPGKSCIPAGRYLVNWTRSPRLRKFTYEITGVPNRLGIRIHAGNLAGDTEKGFETHSLGCPLLGFRVGMLGKQRAVLASRMAVDRFERGMRKEPFWLEVRNV
jgi:hypothetical protein